MNKIANPSDTGTLLSGIGGWGLGGAGIGAAGMGLANILGPKDNPNDPIHKKRSLLKSMLLGGALGGGIGMGARAYKDWADPRYASTSGTGLDIATKPDLPPVKSPNALLSLAGSNVGRVGGLVAGVGGSVVLRKLTKMTTNNLIEPNKASKLTLALNNHAMMGGLSATALWELLGMYMQPKLQQTEIWNQNNTSSQALENLHNQYIANGGK